MKLPLPFTACRAGCAAVGLAAALACGAAAASTELLQGSVQKADERWLIGFKLGQADQLGAIHISGAPIDLPRPGTALLALLGGLAFSASVRQRRLCAPLQPA